MTIVSKILGWLHHSLAWSEQWSMKKNQVWCGLIVWFYLLVSHQRQWKENIQKERRRLKFLKVNELQKFKCKSIFVNVKHFWPWKLWLIMSASFKLQDSRVTCWVRPLNKDNKYRWFTESSCNVKSMWKFISLKEVV